MRIIQNKVEPRSMSPLCENIRATLLIYSLTIHTPFHACMKKGVWIDEAPRNEDVAKCSFVESELREGSGSAKHGAARVN